MSILTTTFGLANSSDPYNFTFTTTPGQGQQDTVVVVTLPDGTTIKEHDMDADRPTEDVNLAAQGSVVQGRLTLCDGSPGALSSVSFTGTVVQTNVAGLDCESNVIAAWVSPA